MPLDDGDPQNHNEAHRTGFGTPEDLSEAAVLKRSYAELQKEYEALKARSSKEKKKRSVKALGRNIVRMVGLDVKIFLLLQEYERRTNQARGGALADDDSDDSDELKRSRDRDYAAFRELCRVIPGFTQHMQATDMEGVDDLDTYFDDLEAGAKSSRGDDINSLKRMAGDILNQRNPSQHLDPDSREGRGLQSDVTGRLLCPITFDWSDPSVRTKLRNVELDINSSFFIRFLYRNEDGDLEEAEKGFLYSDWIVRGLRYVFTSPSSAKALDFDHPHSDTENQDPQPRASKRPKKKATKQTVAQLIGMTEVSPRAIAYIAVLIHFSLTDASSWQIDYNSFDYSAFYNAIVDYFETPKPNTPEYVHTRKILSWYTKKLFPNSPKATSKTAATSFASVLASQRQR